MRSALAVLLGWAAGAPGRDVPVYREYTQPISFYDDSGAQAVFGAGAPDLVAIQLVRDAKAQEGLMGKETVLDLNFGKGGSVFGASAPSAGKMAPQMGGGEERRRGSKDESDRNWLAKSLLLPSLGQANSNAAAMAISADEGESGWGWLADGLSGEPSAGDGPVEDWLEPEEANPLALPEDGRTDPTSGDDRAGKETDRNSADGAFPAADAQGRELSDPGADRAAPAAMQSHRAAPAMAEMSQTRQMIAEFSAGSKPDFSALRDSLVGVSASPQADAPPAAAGLPDFNFRGASPSAWGSLGGRSSAELGAGGAVAPAASSWQGGWKSQTAPGAAGGSLSRFEFHADPVPAPVAPATLPGSSRPGTSSGGYKPAWY